VQTVPSAMVVKIGILRLHGQLRLLAFKDGDWGLCSLGEGAQAASKCNREEAGCSRNAGRGQHLWPERMTMSTLHNYGCFGKARDSNPAIQLMSALLFRSHVSQLSDVLTVDEGGRGTKSFTGM